ncbi:MAG TPA: peptidoglycan DD-metalloendopeptidase family protein [Kofleriaceae bacterium]|nr:peptidoglycan DD-metalloendopeptidase family protein [Kofleriaceae bacterium]
MQDRRISVTSVLFLVCAVAACSGEVAPGGAGSPDGGAPAAAGDPDAAPAEARYGRVAGTGGIGLNLRQAPDTESEILATMPEGAVVDILSGPAGDWYRVRYIDREGYAFAPFVIEIDQGAARGGVLNLLPWTPGVAFPVTQGHNGGSHTGYNAWAWDFGLPVGTPLLAAHNGVVRAIRSGFTTGCCDPSCGEQANFVIIARGDGVESLYLHMQDVHVAVGDEITRGDLIGTSGETGYVCGAHLHFQMQSTPQEGDASYRPSVPGEFHDIGEPFDPVPGTTVVSQNGVLDMP